MSTGSSWRTTSQSGTHSRTRSVVTVCRNHSQCAGSGTQSPTLELPPLSPARAWATVPSIPRGPPDGTEVPATGGTGSGSAVDDDTGASRSVPSASTARWGTSADGSSAGQ